MKRTFEVETGDIFYAISYRTNKNKEQVEEEEEEEEEDKYKLLRALGYRRKQGAK